MTTKYGANLDTETAANQQDCKEAALISRIANGEEDALEQLYHTYYNRDNAIKNKIHCNPIHGQKFCHHKDIASTARQTANPHREYRSNLSME